MVEPVTPRHLIPFRAYLAWHRFRDRVKWLGCGIRVMPPWGGRTDPWLPTRLRVDRLRRALGFRTRLDFEFWRALAHKTGPICGYSFDQRTAELRAKTTRTED